MHNNDEIILQQNFKGINTNLNGIETIKKQMEKCIYKIKKKYNKLIIYLIFIKHIVIVLVIKIIHIIIH